MKKFILAAVIFPMICFGQLVNQQPVTIVAAPNVPAINIVGSSRQQADYLVIKGGSGILASVNTSGVFVSKATTNQIVFAATNTAPDVSTNITTWISVRVDGDTNVYRLPLYK